MSEPESVTVELDTPIGVAAGEAGRHSLHAVLIDGEYAIATDGRILGIRMLAEAPDAPASCRIPAKAATPGRVTNCGDTGGNWATKLGKRKAKITPRDETLTDKNYPPVADVLPEAKEIRWAHLNGEFLARVAKAIGHADDRGEHCQEIYIGIGNEAMDGKPILLMAGDQRGIGLIMPRSSNRGSPTWTQGELNAKFNEFCTTFKKGTS